jgi:hypothetical protein
MSETIEASPAPLSLSADPRSSVASDSVDRLLADVSWWSSYTTLESTVLDAAVEDGRLDLIRTDSLRQLLATWRAGAGTGNPEPATSAQISAT